MMNLLLDTHAALWWWADASELSPAARAAMSDPASSVSLSAASVYEIFQKVRIGKLSIPDSLANDFVGAVRAEGWRSLPISLGSAAHAAVLPHPHRDPFDRMLAAQCEEGGFTLVTIDPFFSDFGTPILW